MSLKKKLLIVLAFILIFILCSPVSAQESRWFLSGFGGINKVFKYGCTCDYEQGVNDFPLTPSHTTAPSASLWALFYPRSRD